MSKDKNEPILSYRAVLWSDGSAKPRNPGCIGWGVHGYVYSDKVTTKGAGHPKVAPTADGYVSKDIKPQPLDIVNYYDCAEWSGEERTNNTAEVAGGARALSYASTINNLKHVTVYSDSKYFVKGLSEGLPNWVANNWVKRDGTEVANIPEWQSVLQAVNTLNTNGVKIRVEWVKGHADNFGNIQADHLASIAGTTSLATRKPGKLEITTPGAGYWKSVEPRHPMLALRGMFFSTDPSFNISGEYFLSSQVKSDEFIGSGDVQSSHAYVKLTTPDPRIEMVRGVAIKHSREFDTLMLARIDRIYDKAVVAACDRFGEVVFRCKETTTRNIHFVNEDAMVQPSKKDGGATKTLPIVEELFPRKLSMRCVEACSILKGITSEFIKADGAPEIEDCHIMDITKNYFEVDAKTGKQVFKKSIHPNQPDLVLRVNSFGKEFDIQLVYGIHQLPRNNLKRLEGEKIQAWLIVRKISNYAVRYLTVVRADGNWMGCSAGSANLKVFKDPFKE